MQVECVRNEEMCVSSLHRFCRVFTGSDGCSVRVMGMSNQLLGKILAVSIIQDFFKL